METAEVRARAKEMKEHGRDNSSGGGGVVAKMRADTVKCYLIDYLHLSDYGQTIF